MRFRKGNKVEVFTKREVPSGSWCCAEIIHGNGHYYTVKYDREIGADGGELFDRIPRKAIRPCPPPTQMEEDWTSGDVVEVFHRFTWKMATVLRALQTGWLLVRLLGSHEIEVNKADVRPRLLWQDDQWKFIGKGNSKCEKRQKAPASLKIKQNFQERKSTPDIEQTVEIQNKSKSLKRKFSSFYHESDAQHAVPSRRTRVNDNGRRRNPFTSLPEKVDIVSSGTMAVGKRLPPFSNRLSGFSGKKLGRVRKNGAAGYSRQVSLDSRGTNSITSSVASCSMSKNSGQAPQNWHPGFRSDDEYNSDAESCCPNQAEIGNSQLTADQKVTEEIHRIELHAYRSTMEALHASGPISWEQETLLTNLRGSLHISNDEHWMELKRAVLEPSTCCFQIVEMILDSSLVSSVGRIDISFAANILSYVGLQKVGILQDLSSASFEPVVSSATTSSSSRQGYGLSSSNLPQTLL